MQGMSREVSHLPQIDEESSIGDHGASSSSSTSFHIDIDVPPQVLNHGGGGEEEETDRKSIKRVLKTVAEARSMLQALADRPDHEAVDLARRKIAEIDVKLSKQLEEIVLAHRPENVDRADWRSDQAEKEKICRQEAEKEKYPFKAVVQLDELHETYAAILREEEEKLGSLYEGTERYVPPPASEEIDEEVVKVLQEATEKNLEKVILNGRMLRFLPEAFGKLRSLLVLNLSNNQLEMIPDSIAGLSKLEELYLSSNLLTSLPDSIGLLSNLKILQVSGNKLKALPDSVSNCLSLVELDASFNQLTYLPTNLGYELVNLKKLLVHLNKLRNLPSSICEMISLQYIDAHFNELRGLPFSIGKLINLEVLDISSNFSDLTELPDSIGDLTNLRELNVSNNQIHALPDTFGRLEKLVMVNLEQNPLVIPPMEIVNQGTQAVHDYMAKRWLDALVEAEQKSLMEARSPTQTGLLTRSTSWLSTMVSGLAGYLGSTGQSNIDPVLDQQL